MHCSRCHVDFPSYSAWWGHECDCCSGPERSAAKDAELEKLRAECEKLKKEDEFWQKTSLHVLAKENEKLKAALKEAMETAHNHGSKKSSLSQALRYAMTRWPALTRYTTDGRLDMTNNAAERAIRPIAIGRKNWTFAGSDDGGRRAATIYTLIETARLNAIDPEAYLRNVIDRIAQHPMRKIHELLPWNITL
jgi:hypothetical protein